MIKTLHKVLFIALLPFLLTGCWDYLDINRRTIDYSIGVDGVNNQVEFTGEAAKLQATGGKVNITGVYRYNAAGEYFEGARFNNDAKNTAPDFLGAARAVVFSRKYAETEGIEAYINRVYYVPEFRNSVLIAISKEPTKEFFAGKVKNDISIGFAVEDTVRTLSENGAAPHKTVQKAKADIEFKDIGYVVPYITKKGEAVEYLGIAVMKDSKMIGAVTREESGGFLFLLEKDAISIMAIPYPGDSETLVSTKNSLKKRKIKTKYKDNKINIYIDIEVKAQIQYLYDIKAISKDNMKKLEKSISEKIKKDVMAALELSKNEYKCDIFGYARYFKADNPEPYKKINWKEEYPSADFHVNVKTTITNTNLLDVNAKKEVK